MTKPAKSTIRSFLIVLFLLLVAYLCRLHTIPEEYARGAGVVRALIYISIFTGWILSVRSRIIQPQTRLFLGIIGLLMVFWFLVRSLKYHVFYVEFAPTMNRYLWYLYYCPMLFIPLLSVFVAVSMGQPEDYRLPRWLAVLYIPTTLLFLLVLTNDLHQMVFIFPPEDTVWLASDHSYGKCYFVVMGWMFFCGVLMLLLLLHKCRIPHSRKFIFLPMVPILVLTVYSGLYCSGVEWLRVVFGDMTAMTCLGFISVLELCIQCSLIRSNTHYDDLLTCCTLQVQLTDSDYHVLLASRSAQAIAPEIMRQTEAGPVRLEDGLRLSGAPVRRGHVLWSEDVSELLNVLEELQDTRDALVDTNALLQAEYTLRAREAHIAEQDRLYDLIQRETAPRIRLLAALTEQFEAAREEEQRRRYLGQMTVVGAYLKRRSNLIFLADRTPQLQGKELELAFGESLDNLELCGVDCGIAADLDGPVDAQQLIALYDLFEEAVERSLDRLRAVTILARQAEGRLSLVMNIDSDGDLSDLGSDTVTVLRDEDGAWQLTVIFETGGAAA